MRHQHTGVGWGRLPPKPPPSTPLAILHAMRRGAPEMWAEVVVVSITKETIEVSIAPLDRGVWVHGRTANVLILKGGKVELHRRTTEGAEVVLRFAGRIGAQVALAKACEFLGTL